VKLPAPARKAILSTLSERDETASICRDKDGNPEPDPELRDTESVPLAERVETFFEREVMPHVPDAWIDTSRRDPRDGKVGLVGYEINFNRYFYRYTPPRPVGGNRGRDPGNRAGHPADAGRGDGGVGLSTKCRHLGGCADVLCQARVAPST
jgi:hypothetical protein